MIACANALCQLEKYFVAFVPQSRCVFVQDVFFKIDYKILQILVEGRLKGTTSGCTLAINEGRVL